MKEYTLFGSSEDARPPTVIQNGFLRTIFIVCLKISG